jgi:hypothetical protein
LIAFTRLLLGECQADVARCGDDARPSLDRRWRRRAESLRQRFSVLKSELNFLLGAP